MRRVLPLSLLTMLTFALAACTPAAPPTEPSPSATAEEKTAKPRHELSAEELAARETQYLATAAELSIVDLEESFALKAGRIFCASRDGGKNEPGALLDLLSIYPAIGNVRGEGMPLVAIPRAATEKLCPEHSDTTMSEDTSQAVPFTDLPEHVREGRAFIARAVAVERMELDEKKVPADVYDRAALALCDSLARGNSVPTALFDMMRDQPQLESSGAGSVILASAVGGACQEFEELVMEMR